MIKPNATHPTLAHIRVMQPPAFGGAVLAPGAPGLGLLTEIEFNAENGPLSRGIGTNTPKLQVIGPRVVGAGQWICGR